MECILSKARPNDEASQRERARSGKAQHALFKMLRESSTQALYSISPCIAPVVAPEQPPSTGILAAVIWRASSEARNR